MLSQLLKTQPVVVTGRGLITAAGHTVEEVWLQACAGTSASAWLPIARPTGRGQFAGCVVREHLPLSHEPRFARKMDRSAQLALAAASRAWSDAQLDKGAIPADRVGIIAATSRGPMEMWSESWHQHAGRLRPSLVAHTAVASLSGVLAIALQAQGPNFTVSATCASSAAAIILAAQQLLTGTADVVLAGGAEAPLNAVLLEQWDAAGLLGKHQDPQRVCRPFDATRNGTVLGEGAAFLVLETLASANRRGARGWARLAGWGLGTEAKDRAGLGAGGAGLARIMEQALSSAGVLPEMIWYINAHGTGTRLNDHAEGRAIRQVFGEDPARVAYSSTKPVTGHCLGAAAAIEAVLSIEALRHQAVPPTANCEQPDPACAFGLVRGAAQARPLSAVMSNSAGLWGNQAALIFVPV